MLLPTVYKEIPLRLPLNPSVLNVAGVFAHTSRKTHRPCASIWCVHTFTTTSMVEREGPVYKLHLNRKQLFSMKASC